ncbi:MAG TPA: FG-GAP-like repeat-containing protein [Acidisarcina sp.]
MQREKEKKLFLTRRALLKGMGLSQLAFRPALLPGLNLPFWIPRDVTESAAQSALADFRLTPHYPAKSPLEDVLRLAPPGSDEFITEKYAFEINALLQRWGASLTTSVRDHTALSAFLHPEVDAISLVPSKNITVRAAGGLDIFRRSFSSGIVAGRDLFLHEFDRYLEEFTTIKTAEFEITGIEQIASAPLRVGVEVRHDILGVRRDGRREERIGYWRTEWSRGPSGTWTARRWEAEEETACVMRGPAFIDVTAQALGRERSYREQMLRGADYWRTVLDGASGIDVYGNNGVAAGDFDNDGFDDLYISQPAGLPNRLYRNRGDGTFEDVTERAGVGVLDSTACALFADFENKGVQDLLVVCGDGPLLFMNQGNGKFLLKRDAFRFAQPPQGTFTHAAIADYDLDGRLDIYFCVYSYYLGLDQYHYPVPYFDARNGPANFLMHNQGNATFEDSTEASGLNAENDRYSFACAWGEANSHGLPDLYVANDFGRSNLYRNDGGGKFTAVSEPAHVQDAGAGMSAAWCDFDNDGKQDIYAANMWSAAGQRVAQQKIFHAKAPEEIRALYRRHARGNSLYKNRGGGNFENVSGQAGAEIGRWSWCSDFYDFDQDGYPDLYVANGYISGPNRSSDLGSFFWRQVVARSPEDATPSLGYEHGWNAIHELIRADSSWSGYERNVMLANNRDGTFTEVSGVTGIDFSEDGRSFALADIDRDGRLEIVLKNRNGPQLRILRNAMEELGHSIVFRLRGTKSNRDAIGTAITVEAGTLRQTRYLQAGSGFLAQHSKELLFGLGDTAGTIAATIRWPSGLVQRLDKLPANHRIEIEEGSNQFLATAFAAVPGSYGKISPEARPEPLPSQVETWLIQPLKAPSFSLPDIAGNIRELRSFQGGFVLLNFWTTTAPQCRAQLRLLQRHSTTLGAGKLSILALNVDEADDIQKARSLPSQERLSFPVLFATKDEAGVYNIIYRYLFDRRRDLPLPTSFLLDKDGMIVKVYQGPVQPLRVLDDVAASPATQADRLKRALPAGGVLYHGIFQRNDFTYGVAMFQHGYLDQAAESFQQVVAEKPDDPEAYYNLGTLNLQRKDLEQARLYLEKTVKLRPNYPEAWNNLGMIAGQQGNIEEAVLNFQKSLLQRPDFTIALLNLGNLYRRQGLADKALQFLGRAIELQPDDPETNYSVGMFYAQQNQIPRASTYLERAVELRPAYPEALNNLGVFAVRSRNYTAAEERFQACIRIAPGFDQAYLNLARLYAAQGDSEKARAVLRQLIQIQPQNEAARQALGSLQ